MEENHHRDGDVNVLSFYIPHFMVRLYKRFLSANHENLEVWVKCLQSYLFLPFQLWILLQGPLEAQQIQCRDFGHLQTHTSYTALWGKGSKKWVKRKFKTWWEGTNLVNNCIQFSFFRSTVCYVRDLFSFLTKCKRMMLQPISNILLLSQEYNNK